MLIRHRYWLALYNTVTNVTYEQAPYVIESHEATEEDKDLAGLYSLPEASDKRKGLKIHDGVCEIFYEDGRVITTVIITDLDNRVKVSTYEGKRAKDLGEF